MKEITALEFEKEVQEVSGIVLVDFFATWCSPCKALMVQFDRLEQKHGDKVKVVKIDVDKETDFVADNFEIFTVPTVVLYKDGVFIDEFSGNRPMEAIESWIKEKAGEL